MIIKETNYHNNKNRKHEHKINQLNNKERLRSTRPSLRVGPHWIATTASSGLTLFVKGTLVGDFRKKRVFGGAQEESARLCYQMVPVPVTELLI